MKRLLFLLALLCPGIAWGQVSVAAGSTSQCFPVTVLDSSSTTGARLTTLAYNTASLACGYYRQNAGTGFTSITLATSTLGTYASGAFKHIGNGSYEFCPPDAALATAAGVNWVRFYCAGAASMVPLELTVQLLSPTTYGYDGKLAAEAAATPVAGSATYDLATGAVDADDQFNNGFELIVFDSAGLVSARSCITDSVNTGDKVVTAEDITALTAVNDNYIIHAAAGCSSRLSTDALDDIEALDIGGGVSASRKW